MTRRLTLEFLKTEAASGMALGLAAVAALAVANSPLSTDYFAWLKSVHAVQIGPLRIEETVSGWIKEGLMSLFFLVVGLEIKHELVKGELSDPRHLATPAIAALGGMVGPTLVYFALTAGLGSPKAGWPIPLATDIAFALAIFALVGRGLPSSLRIFLLTLAIVDDLGAIVLIGVLFSRDVDWALFAGALAVMAAAGAVATRLRLATPFWGAIFLTAWVLTWESGLSTSLTGVAFAAIVPIRPRREGGQTPLDKAMRDLHPWNAFLVLPLFAFAKAGVAFGGLTADLLVSPLVLGVGLSLFLGKQTGVFGAVWLAQRLRLGVRPRGASPMQLYGVCLLCGIGFTMSLFIGGLAFPGAVDSTAQVQVKLGVLAGSALSALAGAAVLAAARGRSSSA